MDPSDEGFTHIELDLPSRRAVVRLARQVEMVKASRRATRREFLAYVIGVAVISFIAGALVATGMAF